MTVITEKRKLPTRLWRLPGAIVLAVIVVGCKSDSASPAPAIADLAGTWTGGIASTDLSLSLTWTAAQSGTTVTGPVTVSVMGNLPPVTGTMTGTGSGNQIALVVNLPSNAFPPSASTCALAGTGLTNTANANKIAGQMNMLVGAGCVAFFGAARAYEGHLDLSKP
mgnify:CR=1 FL=1